MKLINHFVNNTVFLYLQRKERIYRKNYIFFGFVLAFAYCLGLIFLVVNCFRVFYAYLETLWISVLSILILSTTDNYFQVFKDSCKHIIAIFIGSVVSIASISIVGRSIWPNVFIMFIFFFIGTGFFLTSNFFSLIHSKNMFITYYFMVWLIHFPLFPTKEYFYSPVPQLKFLSVAGIALVVCMFTCLILRYSFATDLFVQTSNLLLNQSSQYIKLLDKSLKCQIIKAINCNKNNISCPLEEELFNSIRDDLFKETQPDQLICNIQIAKTSKSTDSYLDFIYNEYSRLLNKLDCTWKQSKKEFWSQDLFIHFERIQILLERNHKKLFALKFGLSEDFPAEICKRMVLPLVPLIEILIKECIYIFNVMSKQLTLQFVHTKENEQFKEWFIQIHNDLHHNIDQDPINETNINNDSTMEGNSSKIKIKLDRVLDENSGNFKVNSMEWYQLEINKSFETIKKTITQMQTIQSSSLDLSFLMDPEYKDSISRISFFIRGFEKFSIEQKSLSTELFLLSYHLSLHRKLPQEVKIIIGSYNWLKEYFKNYNVRKQEKKLKKQIDNEALPSNFQIKFTPKEKVHLLIDYFIFKRLFFNWLFSLKYALACSILAVSVYEITLHSRFVLFMNMDWIPIIFIVIYSPIVGALPIVTVLRLAGAISGGFMGYAALVLMDLVNTRVAQAFIYIGFSFFTISSLFCLIKLQPFEKIVLYVVFGYSVITQFQYQLWTHNIIDSLFRILHICLGLLLCWLVGYILPYYDYRQLEKNCYQLPFGVIKTFSFLLSFSFINNNEIDLHLQQQNSFHTPYQLAIPLNDSFNNNSINDDSISINSNYSDSTNVSNCSAIADNIIPNISTKGLSFQQYRMLGSKINIELRSNFPIQRTLLMDAKFELMFRKCKFKRIETIYLAVEQLYNLYGALDFIISESNQVNLQRVGNLAKQEFLNLLYELNTTSLYLYNIAAFKNDTFQQDGLNEIDRDNSIQLCNQLTSKFRSSACHSDFNVIQLQHCNAFTFILESFVTQYNTVFNLLYDFIKRINIERIKTNNHNVTKKNENLNPDAINYHNNVNEEIKDVRNYQILKILNNK